jgi:tRNA(fMet)-specific endonuclease VapC
MSGRYLLDTNQIIALFAGEVAVTERIANADEVFIPSIVIGELYYGAKKSKRVDENNRRIDEFARENVILSCGLVTAKWYGTVKNTLRQKGRPIPENDIWIAALTFEYDLTLVSRDAHFDNIDKLKLERW